MRREFCAVTFQGKYSEAVESLLTLEKQSRLSEDITSTKMCCKAILEVLYNAEDWQQLNEHILLLAKRRSQLKQVSISPASCPVQLPLVFMLHIT